MAKRKEQKFFAIIEKATGRIEGLGVELYYIHPSRKAAVDSLKDDPSIGGKTHKVIPISIHGLPVIDDPADAVAPV
jgi:hypothetical protein